MKGPAAMLTDEQIAPDLNLNCPHCWDLPCSTHGPVPNEVKVRALIRNYRALARRHEALQQATGENDIREMIAREIEEASRDPYRNLAWMYSDEAATLVRHGADAVKPRR